MDISKTCVDCVGVVSLPSELKRSCVLGKSLIFEDNRLSESNREEYLLSIENS